MDGTNAQILVIATASHNHLVDMVSDLLGSKKTPRYVQMSDVAYQPDASIQVIKSA